MDTQCRPSSDHLYFDNTVGDILGVPAPDTLAAQVWDTLWQTLSPADAVSFKAWEASLILSDNAHVRSLNKQFRGKDSPTNVLSFPDGEMLPDAETFSLGDIIIAVPTVLAEAEAQHKSPQNHLCHLMVHGLLHLCGYDHITDADALVMEDLEKRILAQMNVPNPYEEQDPHE
jgi:probable rRNA maturation factor